MSLSTSDQDRLHVSAACMSNCGAVRLTMSVNRSQSFRSS